MDGLNGFTFFKNYWLAEQQMRNQKDKLSFFEAICAYAFEERVTEMTPAAAAAFTLVQPYLDKSIRKAANGKAGGSKIKANSAEKDSLRKSALPDDGSRMEANGKQTASNIEIEERSMKDEGRSMKGESEGEKEKDSGSPAAAPSPKKEEARKKYGEFGWVRLSDKEYQRLTEEMGDEELQRCIRYIDEAAQRTHNKNKWSDWNLTVRSCHRNGWGLQSERGKDRGSGGLSGTPAKQAFDGVIQYD